MKDNRFGNIDLYLWQLRAKVSKEMWQDCREPFCNFDVISKTVNYQWMGCNWLLSCLLRRFVLDGRHPPLKESELLAELDARGIRYQSSTVTYGTRRETQVQFSACVVKIHPSSFHGVLIQIRHDQYTYDLYPPLRLNRIGARDLVDCILMTETLVERVHEIVREEYAGRLSKKKANRIRKIAARHRRRQGKDERDPIAVEQ